MTLAAKGPGADRGEGGKTQPGASRAQEERVSLPTPTVSAEVVTGKITNRVKVRTSPGVSPARRTKARQPKRYKADPTRGQGAGYRVVCISMSPDELAELDALASRVQMARSHLIRQAVKHFRVKVLGE